jgi:hypothetical protein
MFPGPDRILLDRAENRHAAFGLGIHRCIGSNLARVEIHIAIEEWLGRFPDFVLSEGAVARNFDSSFATDCGVNGAIRILRLSRCAGGSDVISGFGDGSSRLVCANHDAAKGRMLSVIGDCADVFIARGKIDSVEPIGVSDRTFLS